MYARKKNVKRKHIIIIKSFLLLPILQRATLAEKEVNSLKEQLSSTNISSQNATGTNTTSMQNGCLAPSSLASPTMSECSSSGNHLSSKSLNNNKCEEGDENKMDTMNEQEASTANSGRSTPVSMADNKHDENAPDEDDDDVIPVTSTISSTTNSLIGSTAISTAASNTLTASKLACVTADINDNEGKSSNTCDDISAKDKEVSTFACFLL